MKTLIQHNDLILQNYGAAELKAYSEKATYRAFGITLLIIGLLFLLFYINKSEKIPVAENHIYTPVTTELNTFASKSKTVDIDIQMPNEVTRTATGTEKIIATPVPVKDELVKISPENIASVQEVAISAPTLGTAKNIKDILPIRNGVGNNTAVSNQPATIPAIIPDNGKFELYDVDPEVDLVNLQKSVVYPTIPRKAGIEGKVVVRVLIGADGKLAASKIESSQNSALDEAALKAVMTPGIFKPAIQNKIPVPCWISIPINFKLR